jgi:hypothetical protein
MAITPSTPNFFDGTWRGKIRVWTNPVISAGGDTVVVSGIKRIFSVSVGGRPGSTFTYTTTAAGNSAVMLTLTVTASTTGSNTTPLVVYGQ